MKIAYFWFTRWPGATIALPLDAKRIYTGPDTGDYWRRFTEQWTGEDDLVTIEQDVKIHPDVIPQFAACPEPWCSFAYQVGPGQWCHWWLGCTKFSARLQRDLPVSGLSVRNPPEVCSRCGDVPCHRHLDVALQAIGKHLGYEQPHYHKPDIVHLGPGTGIEVVMRR